MKMGLREANQRFSQAMKAVKKGEEVVLTERGKPIAVIKPLLSPEKLDTAIRRLEAAGILRAASKHGHLPSWKPRPIKGVPLSQTLREERDAD